MDITALSSFAALQQDGAPRNAAPTTLADDVFASMLGQFMEDAASSRQDMAAPAIRSTPVERPVARAERPAAPARAPERPAARVATADERPAARPASAPRSFETTGAASRQERPRTDDATDASAGEEDPARTAAATAEATQETRPEDAAAAADASDAGSGEGVEITLSETLTETTVVMNADEATLAALLADPGALLLNPGLSDLSAFTQIQTVAVDDSEALDPEGMVAQQGLPGMLAGEAPGEAGEGHGDSQADDPQADLMEGVHSRSAAPQSGTGEDTLSGNGEHSAESAFAQMMDGWRSVAGRGESGAMAESRAAQRHDDGAAASATEDRAAAIRAVNGNNPAATTLQNNSQGINPAQDAGRLQATDGVGGVQGAERSGDAGRSGATPLAEGPRNAQSQDFASHVHGLKQMRQGATPQTAVTEQVTVQMQRGVASGQDRMTIQLRPEELGRIDIRLDFGADGRVKAQVSADNPLTLELLQRDSRNLERALQDAGLKTDSGSLSFNLRGDGQQFSRQGNGDGASNGQNQKSSLAANDSFPDEADTLTRTATRTYRVANGRVDVRI